MGYSTSINECLQEKINDLFAGAKMEPELAVVLLTVFFYFWNSRKKNKINGVPVVQPLPPFCSVNSKCKKERFRIGGTAITNSNNHLNIETLVGLPGSIQRAISMLSLYNTLKTRAHNRYDISLYQLFLEADIVNYLLKTPVGKDSFLFLT